MQLAGVHCEGKPSFWLSADGSYQEEGQKNVKGPIWDKVYMHVDMHTAGIIFSLYHVPIITLGFYFQMGVKLFCALLSLPVPPVTVNPAGEDVSRETLEQQVLHKLLLVGYQKSGTSTIYKQVIYRWRQLISTNIYPHFGGCK